MKMLRKKLEGPATWGSAGILVLMILAIYYRGHGFHPQAIFSDDVGTTLAAKARSLADLSLITATFPIGFSAMTWINYHLFGNPEWSVQVYPFVCSILAIPMMAWAAFVVTEAWPMAFLAAFLTTICSHLVEFSIRVRPYAGDYLLISTGLVIAAFCERSLRRKDSTRGAFIPYAAALSVGMMLFSFTSVFLTASTMNLVALFALLERKKKETNLRKILLSVLAYDVGVALLAFVLLHGRYNNTLSEIWAGCFMPLHPWRATWGFLKYFSISTVPYGLPFTRNKLLFGFMSLGLITLFVRRFRLMPLAVLGFYFGVLLASGFKMYPIAPTHHSIHIFAMGVFAFTLACDLVLRRAYTLPYSKLAIAALTIWVLRPYLGAISYPPYQQDTGEIVQALDTDRKPGELILLYPAAIYAYAYYTHNPIHIIENPKNALKYQPAFESEHIYGIPFYADYEQNHHVMDGDLDAVLKKNANRIYYYASHIDDKTMDYIHERLVKGGYRIESAPVPRPKVNGEENVYIIYKKS
ncbi:MAG: hypothetical protein ACXWPM_00935 [Bdellovibrionota bacterium]